MLNNGSNKEVLSIFLDQNTQLYQRICSQNVTHYNTKISSFNIVHCINNTSTYIFFILHNINRLKFHITLLSFSLAIISLYSKNLLNSLRSNILALCFLWYCNFFLVSIQMNLPPVKKSSYVAAVSFRRKYSFYYFGNLYFKVRDCR